MRAKTTLALYQPATYQIVVPGRLKEDWSDWVEMAVAVEDEGDGPPVTTLTGTIVDQAALQGLLRRLNSLGLPLLCVICIEPDT